MSAEDWLQKFTREARRARMGPKPTSPLLTSGRRSETIQSHCGAGSVDHRWSLALDVILGRQRLGCNLTREVEIEDFDISRANALNRLAVDRGLIFSDQITSTRSTWLFVSNLMIRPRS